MESRRHDFRRPLRLAAPAAMAAVCAAAFFVRRPQIATSLHDLAGRSPVPAALRQVSDGSAAAVVEAGTAAGAAAAARELAAAMPREFLRPSGGGAFDAALGLLAERRSGLASPENRKLLETPEGRAKIARAAVRRVYSAPLPAAVPLRDDPFLLADSFLGSRPVPDAGFGGAEAVPVPGKEGAFAAAVFFGLAPETASDPSRLRGFAAAAQAAREETERSRPGTRVGFCGVPFHTAAASARCGREIAALTAFSAVFVAAMCALVFRSAAWFPPVAESLAFAAASGALALVLGFRRIHVFSVLFGTTVLGLAVDYSFHWLLGPARDRKRTVRCLAASFATTEAGLLPLAMSPIAALRQTAVFLSFALAGALAFVVLAFPRETGRSAPSAVTPGLRSAARLAALALCVPVVFAAFRIRFATEPGDLYSPPRELAGPEKLLASIRGRAAPGSGFVVCSGSGGLEDLLALEASLDLPANAPRLSLFLPPLGEREKTAALVGKLYAEHGAAQAAALGFGSLFPPPPPEPWSWEDVPEAARGTFAADGALVVPGVPPPRGPLPAGAVFVDPRAELGRMLSEWTGATAKSLAAALPAVFAALLLLRGRAAAAETVPPAFGIAAAAAAVVLGGGSVNLFHLLAFFLLAGMGVDYAVFLRGGGGALEPALCSLLTSMAGFGALAFASFPVVRAFGTVLGTGLPAAFVAALALPAAEDAPRGGAEKCASPLGLEILYWTYRVFGLRALHAGATCAGLCAWAFSPAVRRASRSPKRVAAFARSLADKTAVMSGRGGVPRVEAEDSPDMASFAADVEGGKGVVIATSHCGTAEVLSVAAGGRAAFHAWTDLDRTSVFNSFYLRHAENPRVKLHPVSGFGPETALAAGDWLDAGDCLVMAADTGAGRAAVVPFGGGEPADLRFPYDCNGYEYEFRAAARAIAAGLPECPEAPHSATLAALRAMDALRAAWGVRFPTDA